MPELPEVEVVRRGLERGVVGRQVSSVRVLHQRATRRHRTGPADFAARLAATTVTAAHRRGKYLWLPLDSGEVLSAHLGMSGQLLVVAADKPPETHLRVRFAFADGGRELRFVDQRTFGGLHVEPAGADGVPLSVAHIARDPLDPHFDAAGFGAALGRRATGIKRVLLDQTVISGIGNIYADEALWQARIHYERPADSLRAVEVRRLLAGVRTVLDAALAAGGTSFDALYVSTEGVSGLFARELAAYGRRDQPCPRCSTPIRRAAFMNRSSYFCPRCQR